MTSQEAGDTLGALLWPRSPLTLDGPGAAGTGSASPGCHEAPELHLETRAAGDTGPRQHTRVRCASEREEAPLPSSAVSSPPTSSLTDSFTP